MENNNQLFISNESLEKLINEIAEGCERVCSEAKEEPEIPYGSAYDFRNSIITPLRSFINSLPTMKFNFETPDSPSDALVCAMEILNGACHPSTYSQGILEAAHRVYKKEVYKKI